MKKFALILSIFLTGLAGLTGLAQAQVASTDLLPGTVSIFYPNLLGINTVNFTADNPAALRSVEGSVVGAGILTGTLTDNIANTSLSYEATYFGFRYDENYFNLAADTIRMKDTAGLGIVDESDTDVQFVFTPVFRLGFGVGMSDFDDGTQKIDRLTYGVALNYPVILRWGAAMFHDDMDIAGVAAERDGVMYGITFRRDREWNWHLSYDVIVVGETIIAGVGAGNETTISKATFQINTFPLMLGVSTFDVDVTGSTGDISGTIIDVGWVPEAGFLGKGGLSITARSVKLTDIDPAGPTDDLNENTSVTVAWLF